MMEHTMSDRDMTIADVSEMIFGSASGNLFCDATTLHGRPPHVSLVEGPHYGINADGSTAEGQVLQGVQVGDILEVEYYDRQEGEPTSSEMVYITVTE